MAKSSSAYVKTRRQRIANQAHGVSPLIQLPLFSYEKLSLQRSDKIAQTPLQVKPTISFKIKKIKKIRKKMKQKVLRINGGLTEMNIINENRVLRNLSNGIFSKLNPLQTEPAKVSNQINHVKPSDDFKILVKSSQTQSYKKQNKIQTIFKNVNHRPHQIPKLKHPKIQKYKKSLKQPKKQMNPTKQPNQISQNYQKKIQSKLAPTNQNSPTLLNNSTDLHLKKKGRPKKSIAETFKKTSEEQGILIEFLKNAIKLRNLKSERQFYECFSRIQLYLKDSFKYGDLGEKLVNFPLKNDIMILGREIIRKIQKEPNSYAANQVL